MIHLDFETFSHMHLDVVGAFRYAADPTTEILCAAYAVDNDEVMVWTPDLPPPESLLNAIAAGEPISAHGALFEYAQLRYVTSRLGWPVPKIKQMKCTLARAAFAGLPRGLDEAAASLSLNERKDPDGKRLIKLLCEPQKSRKAAPRRVHPSEVPEDFQKLIAYCRQDVVTERSLDRVLPPLPYIEQLAFELDSLINARGIPLDLEAIDAAATVMDTLSEEYVDLTNIATGGLAPTQRDRMLEWFHEQGLKLDDLQRGTIELVLLRKDLPTVIRDVLEMRLESGRAAPKKLRAMLGCAVDRRARGTLLFYGAHTGRWSGRIIQPHNFPRGELSQENTDTAFKAILTRDAENLKMLFDRPAAVVSSCMRGFIAAPPGRDLIVVDFSAIEARVLVWLAGQEDMRQAYEKGMDLYKMMASLLYNVPIHTVTGEQRRIGKNLILGCGYSLGAGSFVDYCAKAGSIVTADFAERAVRFYRDRHPRVQSFWYAVEEAAITTVRTGRTQAVITDGGSLRFWMDGTTLMIDLPSGRPLYYRNARLVLREGFRGPQHQLEYLSALGARFVRVVTYGGKLVENIVQGLARDILVHAMDLAEKAHYPVVLTVHDEIVSEVDEGEGSPETLATIVSRRPIWAKTLPIDAKGFRTKRYRKD